jgi:hypothetical protein
MMYIHMSSYYPKASGTGKVHDLFPAIVPSSTVPESASSYAVML